MTDTPTPSNKAVPTRADRELELEKLRLDAQLKIEGMRADVRKVVFGTLIVGVSAAFFPFAQEFAKSWFARSVEGIRKEAEFAILQEENRLAEKLETRKFELEQARQEATDITARRDYLERLAQEARSERIERQIITAEFFSFLGEPDMRPQWIGFRDYLIGKQERLNTERSGLLAAVNEPGTSASALASAIERLQQISRLQNPNEDPPTDYSLPTPPKAHGQSNLSYLMLQIAIGETNLGVHEKSQSARVGDYWSALGRDFSGSDLDMAWSGAFVSWVVDATGNPHGLELDPTHITMWRSAHEKGLTVDPNDSDPVPGDIAFRSRGWPLSAWKEHSNEFVPGIAGFVYEVKANEIVVIAGNVNDAVRPMSWRRDDPMIVGFVRLPDLPISQEVPPESEEETEGTDQ